MNRAGFTLLEVLIALAILSSVALMVTRGVGNGLAQVADNGWKDQATRLGRGQMLKLARQGIKANMRGTFAPDHPELTWRATVRALDDAPGRKIELEVRQGKHGLLLEQFIFP